MRQNKQNVFDDFIAAAEYLIAQKYTSPAKSSPSTAARTAVFSRPPACSSAPTSSARWSPPSRLPICCVIPSSQSAATGYPNTATLSNSREEFEYLYAYSPLHNIERGQTYPPILVTTADTDDRVAPLPRKEIRRRIAAKSRLQKPYPAPGQKQRPATASENPQQRSSGTRRLLHLPSYHAGNDPPGTLNGTFRQKNQNLAPNSLTCRLSMAIIRRFCALPPLRSL